MADIQSYKSNISRKFYLSYRLHSNTKPHCIDDNLSLDNTHFHLKYRNLVQFFAAPKVSSIFHWKVSQKFRRERLNLSKFRNFVPNFGINCNFQNYTKMKILEGIVYVISQHTFLGGQGNKTGRRRNIAASFGKFRETCEFKISPILQH